MLGEAAAAVSAALKAEHPEIPWRHPVRLRNRVVHGYWSIDFTILHTTANDQLGALVTQLRKLLDGQ
ncbi:MAG: DUF86 domain-containing protein [Actinomycetota bacterium]|nr:DUF86 domain-containing protein [Actinomycetota bacterium]